MHILHLPLEILDLIVYHSILVRTLPRALRLKLVCSKFVSPLLEILDDLSTT